MEAERPAMSVERDVVLARGVRLIVEDDRDVPALRKLTQPEMPVLC